MIRLFKVHYPLRTLVLLVGEAFIVGFSFVAGMLLVQQLQGREYGLLRVSDELFIEGGYLKILVITGIVLLVSHGFDLYDSSQAAAKLDQTFRLLFVLGLVALVGWRAVYAWLVQQDRKSDV